MSYSTGFFSSEATIYYECNIEDEQTGFEQPKVIFMDTRRYNFKTSFLGFLYVFSGELTVQHCGEILVLPQKTMLVTSPDFSLNFIKGTVNCEVISAQFHSSIINKFEKSQNLFKIFYTDSVEKRVYTPKMHGDNIIVPLMNSLKSSVLQHYNEPFIFSRIITIVTELNTIFDRCFKQSEKEIPNISAKVIDYIERHYTEKITMKDLCDKFFISPSSIHRICKKAFGKTFKEELSELRLREARALIQKKNILPSKAAKICGYSDYSSFFRAYKKNFNISPNEDINSKQRWPMS